MARRIATRALAELNTVTLLGAAQDKVRALAGELSGDVKIGTVGEPISSDVVVVTVRFHALDDLLGRLPRPARQQDVLDITGPVEPQLYGPLTVQAARPPRRSRQGPGR